jgi:uncharacterized protein YeaO (DUF488 family)
MPLQIYTARISYSGPDRLDVTRAGGSIFGPSWDLLDAGRSGEIEWVTYVEIYMRQMRWCWQPGDNPADERRRAEVRQRWLELLRRDRVVLCCYCVNPKRCHRTVLAGLLVKAGEHVGMPAEYLGELDPSHGA